MSTETIQHPAEKPATRIKMDDVNRFSFYDADVIIHPVKRNRPANVKRRSWGPAFKAPDWETFNRLVLALEGRGFEFKPDPWYTEKWSGMDKNHLLGSVETPHGTLYVAAQAESNSIKFEFFQEIVKSHKVSGRHDFDRIKKMPYLIRKKFEGARRGIAQFLMENGFHDATKCMALAKGNYAIGRKLAATEDPSKLPTLAESSADQLRLFNEGWCQSFYFGELQERFKRDANGWPADSELNYGNKDRDGAKINHGDYRYFRDHKGRLVGGHVYGGINGMWTLLEGCNGTAGKHKVSAYSLFSCDPRTVPYRMIDISKQIPVWKAQVTKAVREENFERAIVLRDIIRRHQTKEN